MKTITLFISVFYIIAAGLSFWGIAADHNLHDGRCLAEIAAGADCNTATPVEEALFHVEAFQHLSHGVFESDQFRLHAGWLLVGTAILFLSASPGAALNNLGASKWLDRRRLMAARVRRRWLAWLSFIEHTDPLRIG